LVKKTIVLKIVLFFSSNKLITFNFKNTGFINYDIILEGTLSKIKTNLIYIDRILKQLHDKKINSCTMVKIDTLVPCSHALYNPLPTNHNFHILTSSKEGEKMSFRPLLLPLLLLLSFSAIVFSVSY
jgi:hypothetical protein